MRQAEEEALVKGPHPYEHQSRIHQGFIRGMIRARNTSEVERLEHIYPLKPLPRHRSGRLMILEETGILM